VRAVLDVNILISALLSPQGAPAELLTRWVAGEFELIASDALLAELERALGYPKVRSRVPPGEAARFIDSLRRSAELVPDAQDPQARSADPGDDYLLALAETASAVLVSGDRHLLDLGGRLPVQSARGFLESLDQEAS
jgi:putative PIN family toxin of toxin-antitoxin system